MTFEILIADDHAFTAGGLQAALSGLAGCTVLPPVTSGLDAISLARQHRPALAVLDYAMPDATGLEVFLDICRWSPTTLGVIVTANTSPAVLNQLYQAGVHGLFPKSILPDVFCDQVQRVLAGERVIDPQLAALIHEAGNSPILTARETEVLLALSKGLTTAAIAEALSISPKTVEHHRSALMRKLNVGSAPALLMRAMRLGLVD